MELQNGLGRELLWGLLACQSRTVSREALGAALEERRCQEHKPLDQVLRDRHGLDAAQVAAVNALARDYLDREEQDPLKVLQAVALGEALERLLDRVTDPEWRTIAPAGGGGGRDRWVPEDHQPHRDGCRRRARPWPGRDGQASPPVETEQVVRPVPGSDRAGSELETTLPSRRPGLRLSVPRVRRLWQGGESFGRHGDHPVVAAQELGRRPDDLASGRRRRERGAQVARPTGRLAGAVPDRPTACGRRAGRRLRGAR